MSPSLKTLPLFATGCLFLIPAQAEPSQAAEKSPSVIERTGVAIERGTKAAAQGVEHGAQATCRALSKASQKIGITKASNT